MHFKILVATSFFVTLVAGLAIPANILTFRDLEIREGLVEDGVDILVREPLTKVYKIPARKGHPAAAYTKTDFKANVARANEFHRDYRDRPQTQKAYGLVPHQNKGIFRAFRTKKNLQQFPIYTSDTPSPHGRIILKEKNGKLEFKGVAVQKQNGGYKRVLPTFQRGGKK